MKKKFGNGNGSGMDRDFIGNGSVKSRKLFALLFCLLFVGVGNVWGASTTTYTFASENWTASPANWTSNTAGSGFEGSGSARGVANNGVNGSCTSPTSFSGVTSIEIIASANKNDGKIKVLIGSTEIAEKTILSSTDVTYTYNSSDYSSITSLSGNIRINVTAPSNSKTLWVKSVKITYVTEKFTITYEGGSGTPAKASETQGSIGQMLTLPSSTPSCESEWRFAGWTTSSCSETKFKPTTLYAAGSSYLPLSSHTLYAVYMKGNMYSVDFESESSAYTDWTFTNMTSQHTHANIPSAHSGSYCGSTGGKTTASITTNTKLASPNNIRFYVSKQSSSATESTWYIQTSSDGSEWDNRGTQDAAGVTQGEWTEVTLDLSSYHDVYVRVYYSGNTAVRNIDDVELSCATYNSDCVYDWFVDIMHNNTTTSKQGSTYTTPDLDDEEKGTHCSEAHYHFVGWVVSSEVNPDGTLKSGYTLIPGGDDNSGSGYTASNKTFYAIWTAEE